MTWKAGTTLHTIFVLLFIIQFPDFLHPFMAVSPTVEVVQTQSSFIEDQKTTFVCKIWQNTEEITGIWFLRDPKTKSRLFFTSSVQTSTIREKFKGNKLVLHLVMRRDFSGVELVCQISNGEENSYLLPAIEKTIPVERVRFIPTHYVPNGPYKIYCEIKAKPNVVKTALLRTRTMILRPTRPPLKNNETTIFQWSGDKTSRDDVDGHMAQCIAVTDSILSENGHVTSTLVLISIPNFKEQVSTVQVQRGDTRRISFGLKTRVTPLAKNFDFVVTGNANSRHSVKPDFKVESSVKGTFEVTANISPKRSGNYTLRYNSGIFNTTSQPLLVKVLYFEFATNSSSEDKSSNAKSSFWTEFHVRKNEITNITIPVNASPKPDRHFFHLFSYENTTVPERRQRRNAFLKNVQVNETAGGSERELFQVSLEFLPLRSGQYGILFYKSRGFYVPSKPFYVHLHYLEFTSYRWSFEGIIGLHLSAVIEFHVKAEPLPEKNHFSVHCGDETLEVNARNTQVTRMSVADHQYRVSISFSPSPSKRCKVHYNSNYGVSARSMEFITSNGVKTGDGSSTVVLTFLFLILILFVAVWVAVYFCFVIQKETFLECDFLRFRSAFRKNEEHRSEDKTESHA